MIETIIKRSGRKEKFQPLKIEEAIFKAIMSLNDLTEDKAREQAKLAANVVVFKLNKNLNEEIINLEEVQDMVEETLMQLGMTDVARSYIRYRHQREQMRKDKEAAISVEKMMGSYMKKEDWRVKENSNMDYSLQGLNNYIVSDITKSFWLNHVFSTEERELHEGGSIHIHDLGLLSTYCCGWDLEGLLIKGFKGVPNKISSAPAKHFKTALGQLVNFIYTLQGEAAGAQAVSSFDTYLAPFIAYDKLEYKEVKQAMQEFIFNVNVPTRVGFQCPFFNITLDLKAPSTLKDKPVIIGGEYKEKKYGEFQKEMDMINKAFCEVMMNGDSSGRIFSFPIPTYNVTKDFDWDSEVVNDIMKMTSKYGIPYFANFINSDMKPEDTRSMCCRLRIDLRELHMRGGGLFGANPLTGSIGVVTINLPRLGYLYKDVDTLKLELEKLMNICKHILETKRKFIEKNTEDGLYPYSKVYLEDTYTKYGEYWKNHFNTIGINGMNECIRNFFNDTEDITTKKGQKFAKDILDFMRKEMLQYQKEGNLYNLEATPAEGTAYRLAKCDRKLYPDIITAGNDEVYYTNSTQLPVGHTSDLFEALNLQDDLQTKYTGGTVFHAFLGEKIDNFEVTKKLIKNTFENYSLPYFSITPTFSVCEEHGYLSGEVEKCPKCGRETEIWTRVVGFYRPVKSFNPGKKEEYKERKEFVVE